MKVKTITWDDWMRLPSEAKAGLALEFVGAGQRPDSDDEAPVKHKAQLGELMAMASGLPIVSDPDLYLSPSEYKARPATPQTRAKLERDVVNLMIGRGVLTSDHIAVVDDMLDLAEAFRVGGGCTWAVERVQSGGGWASPFERQSERVHCIYRRRFRPWLVSLVKDPIEQETATLTIRYLCAPAFVRYVVQENMTIKDAERRCGIAVGMGRGACLLRIALDRYLDIVASGQFNKDAEKQAFRKAA